MQLKGIKAGFAITGSFCTFGKIMPEVKRLMEEGAEVFPIMSETAFSLDTKFGKAAHWKEMLKEMTGKDIIASVKEAEPIGPASFIDVLVIAPCTGNTLGKIANGITDSSVTMAAKAHLRNGKPVVIGVSSNDGLSANAKNLGLLLNTKNIYFVPFGQDDPIKKPSSVLFQPERLVDTVSSALKGNQLQPVLSK